MKKTIAVVATLAMAAALSVSAFAADHTGGGVPEVNPTQIHKGDEEAFKQGEWVNDVEADCGHDGIWRYSCSSDPSKIHEIHVAATGEHKWSSEEDGEEWGKVTKDATCTEEGEAIDYCKVCGETRTKIRKLDKTPHTYKEKEIEGSFKKATCAADGEVRYHNVCENCGDIQKKDGKEVTRKDTWKWDDPGKNDDEYNAAHKWENWVHEKAATCDATGTDIRWCKVCGAKEKKTLPVLDPVWTKAVKSEMIDCYTEKVTYTCAVCEGKKNPDHKAHEDIRTTKAHTFNAKPDQKIEATCLNWGYDLYLCKDFDIDSQDDKHHHTDVVEKVEKKNLDGTKTTLEVLDGYKVEWHEPLGHDWGEWIERHKGDTSTYWLRTCKRCKATEEQISNDKPTETPVPQVGKNGFIEDEDGTWRLYENDEVNKKYTGLYNYNGGEFFLNKGVLDEKANGLNLIDGTWYFLANGQVQRGVNEPALYDNNWFMLKDGELDENANGLYPYDGGTFLFAAGKLRRDVNGLWQDAYGTYGEAGKWYFLAEGQVVDYTGVAEYNGAFFVVEKGVFNNEYNGTIEYDGATFNVVNGQLYDQVKTEEAA